MMNSSYRSMAVFAEKVPKNCLWAIFVVGAIIIVQSINNDIVIFTITGHHDK